MPYWSSKKVTILRLVGDSQSPILREWTKVINPLEDHSLGCQGGAGPPGATGLKMAGLV